MEERGLNVCKDRGRSSRRREVPREKEGGDGGSLSSAPSSIPGGGVVGTGGPAPGLPSSAEPEADLAQMAADLPAFKGLSAITASQNVLPSKDC